MDLEHKEVPPKGTSEASLVRSLRRKGYTEQKISSYLRGWRMAGNNRGS
jgi:SOS response regulatory protein OraA/RecX